MSDNFFSNSFPKAVSDSNIKLYNYNLEDFEKALDCLFLISDFGQKASVSLMQPVNILIGKSDTELLIALNYSKAIYGYTRINTIKKSPITKEQIERAQLRELGMKTECFIELPNASFDKVIKKLVEIWNKNENFNSRFIDLIKLYQDKSNNKDIKKCVDAVIKATENLQKADEKRSMLVKPLFKARSIEMKLDECFCILSFEEKRLKIFTKVIKPYLRDQFNIKAIKSGDNYNSNSDMIEDIWEKINEAAFIIADLSDNKPNVFYELGICHTLGKKVIQICDKESRDKDYNGKLPFDINTRLTYFYENSGAGSEELKDNFEKCINQMNTVEKNIE